MKITPEQCDEVIAIIERIKGDLPTVYELDKRLGSVEQFDGFRSSVRPMEGSTSTVLDDEGFPVPPLSDPTGDGVVAVLEGTRRRSSVRDDVALMNACLAEIRGLANQADGARGRAMLPPGEVLNPDSCVVHLRHGLGHEAVYRCKSCRWCYEFSLAEGVDPPAELLQARARGQRITESMVRDALRHQPRAKSRKKGRRAS